MLSKHNIVNVFSRCFITIYKHFNTRDCPISLQVDSRITDNIVYSSELPEGNTAKLHLECAISVWRRDIQAMRWFSYGIFSWSIVSRYFHSNVETIPTEGYTLLHLYFIRVKRMLFDAWSNKLQTFTQY